MVRPARFGFNPETAENNSFQQNDNSLTNDEIAQKAIEEFDNFVAKLKAEDINVDVFQDLDDPNTPDAVFPNNWITFHSDGTIISYPMYAPIRRLERRRDIVDDIEKMFTISKDYTFEQYEDQGLFLEGTGSLILDRENKIAYAALSPRTNVQLLDKWCLLMGYTKVNFLAVDRNEEPIYHTNVMMALGEDFVVICLDSIRDNDEKNAVLNFFEKTNKKVIDISYDQMESFAGNMLQLRSNNGLTHLVMSSTARKSLQPDQIDQIEKFTNILVGDIPTIETYGGGSVRCMIAENFLTRKKV